VNSTEHVAFPRPTKAFQDGVAEGFTALLALSGSVALGGGVPLIVGARHGELNGTRLRYRPRGSAGVAQW
jgi:hypothetical protein